MNRLITAVALMIGLSACAHELGYAGAHPGAYECKGKATISFQGGGAAGAGIAAAELNTGSIVFDCGDGAYLKQGLPAITDSPAKP